MAGLFTKMENYFTVVNILLQKNKGHPNLCAFNTARKQKVNIIKQKQTYKHTNPSYLQVGKMISQRFQHVLSAEILLELITLLSL